MFESIRKDSRFQGIEIFKKKYGWKSRPGVLETFQTFILMKTRSLPAQPEECA